MKDYGYYEDIVADRYDFESEEDKMDEFLDDVMKDFDHHSGIGTRGYEKLSEIDSCAFEYAWKLGKEKTGILDLYMLAFKLAKKQLERK